MKKVLLIGGPADGKRMEVAKNVREITVPEMPDVELLSLCSEPPTTIPVLNECRYFVHEYLTDIGVLYFATMDYMPQTPKIMQALFDWYRVGVDHDD